MVGFAALATAALLVAAGLYAERSAESETVMLAGLAPVLERWIDISALAGGRVRALLSGAAIPTLLAALAGLAVAGLRRRPAAGPLGLLSVIAVACVGQAALLDGRIPLGAALYAAALILWATRSEDASRAREDLSPLHWNAALVLLLAVFALACLYRLDVYPDVYVDEGAYLNAARMQLGEIDSGWILRPPWQLVYSLERFRAQPIPLLLQAGATALLAPGVTPTRLTALAAGSAALLAAALCLRPALGGRATLWMVALASASPLYLAYSRAGLYIGVSILHGALAFAALCTFLARRTFGSAALLGTALGASLYCYQVSWFVPVLALAGLAAVPPLRWRANLPKLALAAGSALAVAVPGLVTLREGFAAVSAQTFDRAVWRSAPPNASEKLSAAFATLSAPFEEADARALIARIEASALTVQRIDPEPVPDRGFGTARELRNALGTYAQDPKGVVVSFYTSETGAAAVRLLGRTPAVGTALDALGPDRDRILLDTTRVWPPWRNLAHMLADLVYAAHWEVNGRLSHGPVLNPLLAPLALLGLVELVRRRRSPVCRLLLVWILGGALLPSVVAGALPRRAVLMLPFALAAAALPLTEVGQSLAARPWGRSAARVGSALFLAAALGSGAHAYFGLWDVRFEAFDPARAEHLAAAGLASARSGSRRPTSKLLIAKRVRAEGRERPILVPELHEQLAAHLHDVEQLPSNVASVVPVESSADILRASCERGAPLTWITADTEAQRVIFSDIAEKTAASPETRGAYLILRIERLSPTVCRPTGGDR